MPVKMRPANLAMQIVFRVDASIEIGTGHVMRCLTLADALKQGGAECHFICRDHNGNLNDYIRQRGYLVYELASSESPCFDVSNVKLQHEYWLQTSWDKDSAQSYDVMQQQRLYADWLVLDHYGLDARWQTAMRPAFKRLMVIDDLADRQHIADLLLDQNLGRRAADYDGLVPESCVRLIGPRFALLRPEFAQWRPYSLERRQNPELKHILITMGGVDKDNVTGRVLEVLAGMDLPPDMRISVVMGAKAPWLDVIRSQVQQLERVRTSVLVNVDHMAELMAKSDLVIGAAGTTSWERCTLGIPTLMVSLAANQMSIAQSLHQHGAAINVDMDDLKFALVRWLNLFLSDPKSLVKYADSASNLSDGYGAQKVGHYLIFTKAFTC